MKEQSTEATEKFTIGMGALCDPLASQLKKQKLKFDAEKVAHFEKALTAIITLKFAHILPDSVVEKCRQKLFKQITKHVQDNNSKH